MPKRIPIIAAKRFMEEHGCKQVVIVAFDGELTHVVTYGKSVSDSDVAAQNGNTIKRLIGFSEEDCSAVPARVKRKAREL